MIRNEDSISIICCSGEYGFVSISVGQRMPGTEVCSPSRQNLDALMSVARYSRRWRPELHITDYRQSNLELVLSCLGVVDEQQLAQNSD
jgi:hypothetical protein